jgi:hypothetical protein
MKTVSIFYLLAVIILFANDSLQSQNKPLPVALTIRNAFNNRSYVLQIRNSSDRALNLWLQAKGIRSSFLLPAGKLVEYGWAQGYHFDANNTFFIGEDGYDTIKNVMPNIELSPWRLQHRKEGGFELSFSKYYIQKQAENFKLPIKQTFSSIEIEINQLPQIELKDGSNKMYAHCILEASVAGRKIPFPITTTLSFIPEYVPATGQLVAFQIQIENVDNGIFPQQYVDDATKLVNAFLPAFFSNYVLYTVDKTLLPFAKLFKVQDARVSDGRLELSIF